MKKILVIGHSHLNALIAAGAADSSFLFITCEIEKNGVVVDRPFSDFHRINGANYASIVLLIKGSRHIALGLVNHPTAPYDFHLPECPDLPINPAAEVLPVDLVERILKRHMGPELRLVAAFAQTFRQTRLYQIESPPPLSRQAIEKYPATFKESIARHGLSPAAFRHKMWRLHSKIVREHAAGLGITFVGVPAQALDQQGCLAEQYVRNDPAHGNAAYGDLVLNQLRELHGLAAQPL